MTSRHSAIHPGDILAEELKAIGMHTDQLAQALPINTHKLELLIQGKDMITADTAYLLGRYFGTGPELWLDLQTAYVLETQHLSRL